MPLLLAALLVLGLILTPLRAQVPQSTDEIARTIGMCTIRAANLAEQLNTANAKIEQLNKQIEDTKKPKEGGEKEK